MSLHNLPSLQSLKVFECIAHLNSFTFAANELGISQSAVSQHVKNLEIRVGFKVFNREKGKVTLTLPGIELLRTVKTSLGQIQKTIELERHKFYSNELVVSVLPGFAARWLLPRLMQFHEQYPDIKLSVNTISSPLEFDLYHAHAGLSYSPNENRNPVHQALFTEHLFPICSKSFAASIGLKAPLNDADIAKMLTQPMLGDRSPTLMGYTNTWSYWLKKLGLELPHKNMHLQSQSNITIQLAELGHGIAIGRTSLVMDALDSGLLMSLTKHYVENPCSYYLVKNPTTPASNGAIKTFTHWLHDCTREIENYVI